MHMRLPSGFSAAVMVGMWGKVAKIDVACASSVAGVDVDSGGGRSRFVLAIPHRTSTPGGEASSYRHSRQHSGLCLHAPWRLRLRDMPRDSLSLSRMRRIAQGSTSQKETLETTSLREADVRTRGLSIGSRSAQTVIATASSAEQLASWQRFVTQLPGGVELRRWPR